MIRSAFRNIVTIPLSLALIVAFLPMLQLNALALTTPDGFEYEEYAYGIKIINYTGAGGNVVIPDQINGKNVFELGNNSFINNTGITNVVIPNTVTRIGVYAFANCTNLLTINIPDSVITIAGRAFSNCPKIQNFTFGKGVVHIGDNAFFNCDTLTDVVLPPLIQAVYDSTFYNCANLVNVTIPAGVTKVEIGAFATCPRLVNAYFLGNAPSIHSNAFEFGIPADHIIQTLIHFFQHSTGYVLGTWSPNSDYAVYNTVWMDYTGAVLQAGTATRTSDTTATITYTSDKPGWAFYQAVAHGADPPDIWCTGSGASGIAGTNTLNITNLTAGAKDVYIRFKDTDGKHSTQLKYELPATPDQMPTVQFSQEASSGSESTTPATIEVKLSAASTQTVTVKYETGDYDATAGNDYTATSGTLTFSPGELTKNISVPIIDDAVQESNETFTVTLTDPVNATLGTITVHAYTINENEIQAPTVQFSQTASSGSESTTPATIEVKLSAASAQTVTVQYATANGTATAGSDYTAASGTLTFAPGEATKNITVPIINDAIQESSETFTMTLTDPINAILGAINLHTYTINGQTKKSSFLPGVLLLLLEK